MPTDDRKRGHQDRGNPSMRDDDRGTSARQKVQAPDQRGGDVPPQTDHRETHVGGGRARVDANEGPASGSVDRPIPPGEYQAGDLGEQAQQLGGPVDVFPTPGQSRKDGPAG